MREAGPGGWLLLVNALYFLFGATMYMGTMWVLKFFLYPTWRGLTPETEPVHFAIPTLAATKFFTFVVPLMLVAGAVLVVSEWGHPRVWLSWVCVAGIIFLTYVGQVLIIPINKKIRAGTYAGVDELRALLRRWMWLNDLRFYGSTVLWLVIVGYIVDKGQLAAAFS
ncbi:DUF1772 domain-containing protein [Cryobacterium psychrophilum]|uniref:DUF1772 domain-containing protein n=1 Tax=Cryobacterium psychrophilum TaxID=41988 RepID=A0A4Y8KKR9_9MICO|nr:DUF1772 domain-containing protein [Cryobacterium psychrophilum]TDW30776.1 uncharacterized protein DUF1772 [Cryobacterium psychrophilum]TFD75822.1 DUF1772 domain-containing protein [Cryobacterium psychrophilum]